MGFLLEFIKKDAQADGLLEKLCIRIVAASDEPQQCRDLSYCLAQLQVGNYILLSYLYFFMVLCGCRFRLPRKE